MIRTIRNKGLKDLLTTGKTRRIEPTLQPRCLQLLNALQTANYLRELDVKGFNFHGLQGVPKRYALKVNHNWRMTFGWEDGAIDVDYEDYH